MLSYLLGIAVTGCSIFSCGKGADPLMVSLKRERGWADTAHATEAGHPIGGTRSEIKRPSWVDFCFGG